MILLVPLLASLCGAPPAAAPQPAGAVASAPAPQPVPARAARGATGGELLDRASKDIARLRRALTEALTRVEDARHERDLAKLLCLDDKISQIKALVTVGERAETALTEAVIVRDDGALVELSKIAIARAKVDALRAEAAACIGQLAYEVAGRTEVYVEEPEELPGASEVIPVVRSTPGADPYRTEFGIPSATTR